MKESEQTQWGRREWRARGIGYTHWRIKLPPLLLHMRALRGSRTLFRDVAWKPRKRLAYSVGSGIERDLRSSARSPPFPAHPYHADRW